MNLIREIRGAVARGWCDEKNSSKEMDADLAEAITLEVVALWGSKAMSSALKKPMKVKEARATIAKAFQDDPYFRRGYVDNVACLIMDNIPGFKRRPLKRNEIADKIIRLIFED